MTLCWHLLILLLTIATTPMAFIAVLNHTQTKLKLRDLRNQCLRILALIIVTKEAINAQ